MTEDPKTALEGLAHRVARLEEAFVILRALHACETLRQVGERCPICAAYDEIKGGS